MSSSERRRFLKTCEKMIGRRIERAEYPGGKSRESCKLFLEDGRTIYATQRAQEKMSVREFRVLKALHGAGAPVPKVFGFKNGILLQQDLGDQRLSQALAEGSSVRTFELLDASLASLTRIHRAAEAAGLDEAVPQIGQDDRWLDGLLRRPKSISRQLEILPPAFDSDALKEIIRTKRPRLVKWDARPGNAVIPSKGGVAWIDWEHCGARQRLDDLVWLLGDEATPDVAEVEERLLKAHVSEFADGRGIEEALEYVAVLMCFHSCVRLELILEKKDGGDWWDADYCLQRDKVGVTLEGVHRLCSRGARWSRRSEHVRALTEWFALVAELFGTSDVKGLGPGASPIPHDNAEKGSGGAQPLSFRHA